MPRFSFTEDFRSIPESFRDGTEKDDSMLIDERRPGAPVAPEFFLAGASVLKSVESFFKGILIEVRKLSPLSPILLSMLLPTPDPLRLLGDGVGDADGDADGDALASPAPASNPLPPPPDGSTDALLRSSSTSSLLRSTMTVSRRSSMSTLYISFSSSNPATMPSFAVYRPSAVLTITGTPGTSTACSAGRVPIVIGSMTGSMGLIPPSTSPSPPFSSAAPTLTSSSASELLAAPAAWMLLLLSVRESIATPPPAASDASSLRAS
mmetsp:Transcript_44932/g.123149  ORF Transcript_44932/g.123149 Transcript_44932/m.123149 type:complete len:265 (+) Transcript_44932:2196-2990(+)